MREASLKLKRTIENVNITNNHVGVNRIILNSMLLILAAVAFWYVLMMGNLVFDIVGRKALEKEALALANEVSQLELDYLRSTGSLDLTISESMGFTETKATFATRKSLGSISMGGNEI